MSVGVLVMAYGTPTGPDDVAAFYTDVRRGRPPSPEQLEDLERRYRAIGGLSPLNERTAAQLAALEAALSARAPDTYQVFYGAKHAVPKIEDAVDTMAALGIERLVGLVLAPHYSRLSVGEYVERASSRAAKHGIACGFVEHWHDDEALITVLAERVAEGAARLAARPGRLEVVFSAHSLPSRIGDDGDPYPRQLEETARLVALRAGLSSYRTGFQSASVTREPWLGPDILVVLESLVEAGYEAVLVCPAGFTSDHLEILYDLDIQAREKADALGIAFARTASLNDDARIAGALAARVVAATPQAATSTIPER